MDPLKVFRLLRRRWRLIAGLALLGAIIGATSGVLAGEDDTEAVPEITAYAATHTLIVDLNASAESQAEVRNLAQLAQRVVRGDIPVTVADALGRNDADSLAASVAVTVRADIQSLEITAVDLTADGAVEVADAFADALLAHVQARLSESFQAAIDDAQTVLDGLDEQISELESDIGDIIFDNDVPEEERDAAAEPLLAELDALNSQRIAAEVSLSLAERAAANAPPAALSTLDSATPVTISESVYQARLRSGALGNNITTGFEPATDLGGGGPSDPLIPDNPVLRAIIGALLGLAVGAVVVLAIERLDPRIRTKEDIEEIADLPVVAEVPVLGRAQRRTTEVLSFSSTRSRTAESYRVLRSSLNYAETVLGGDNEAEDPGGATVILVTSPGPSEGKTTTVANLAAVLAEKDARVLVVNCDFRRPRLHDYLGGNDEPQSVNPTTIPGVRLITHVTKFDAQQNPAEVVKAQMRVIERARERFDYIVLDTAPLLTTNDATDVLDIADHVLLVAQAGKTTAEAVDRAAELLERRGAPVLGVVLVGARDVPGASGYYYDGDDPYLVPSKPDRRAKRRRSRRADRRDTAEATVAAPPPASTGSVAEPAPKRRRRRPKRSDTRHDDEHVVGADTSNGAHGVEQVAEESATWGWPDRP